MAGAAWSVETIVRDMMVILLCVLLRNRLYCTPLCFVVGMFAIKALTSAGEFKKMMCLSGKAAKRDLSAGMRLG